jgi:hypothetical protein
MGVHTQQQKADGWCVGSTCRVVGATPDLRRACRTGFVRVERVEIIAGEVMKQMRDPSGIGELTGFNRGEHVLCHQRVAAQEDRARVARLVPPVDPILHAIHHRGLSRHQILL